MKIDNPRRVIRDPVSSWSNGRQKGFLAEKTHSVPVDKVFPCRARFVLVSRANRGLEPANQAVDAGGMIFYVLRG